MERLIVEFVFRAALIAAAAAVILRILGIRTPATQHAFWTGVLVVMLALPVWISRGPKAALPVLPAHGLPAAAASVVTSVTADPAPGVPSPYLITAPAPARNRIWNTNLILTCIYLFGASILLLRLVIGTIRASRLTSAFCVVPVTVGLFRPRLILPDCWKEWPDAQLDAVLTHERAHMQRRDPLVQWLSLFNRALFWFHPLAWWLERHLSALAEEACDQAVLDRGHDPRDYSQYLLELSRIVQRAGLRVSVTGMAMPGSYLPQRVRKIIAGIRAPRISRLRMAGAAFACAICSMIFAAITLAQVSTRPDPQAQFEVASVKPSAPVLPGQRVFFGPARGGPGTSDPGQINWMYPRMIDLLTTAYDVKVYQITGPGWIMSERYDVIAKMPAGATKSQVAIMWQNLLAERFGIKLHHEPKEFQVEELVVAAGGTKLKKSAVDDPDGDGPPQFDEKGQLNSPGQVITITPGPNGPVARAVARSEPLSKLTAMVGNQIGRPVLDKTGLNGKFDYDLEFTPVSLPGLAEPLPASPVGPDIMAAIRQQLGLRLVPAKATLDVLVIDKAEKVPTAN